jgi:conjugal transfer pilus assembly protein TraW
MVAMRRWQLVRTVVAAAGLALAGTCFAEDLGVQGQTYRPERDGREQIKDKLRAKESSGELDRFWRDYRDKTLAAVRNPPPLGIPVDLAPRVEMRELKWRAPVDYRDQAGRVVLARGTVIEPLKRVNWRSGLIWIDGRDERQVRYAVERGRRERLKIVLVGGSFTGLMERYAGTGWWDGPNVPFYFDQRGTVMRTLQTTYGVRVASVPLVMTQAGEQLRLEYGFAAGGANANGGR